MRSTVLALLACLPLFGVAQDDTAFTEEIRVEEAGEEDTYAEGEEDSTYYWEEAVPVTSTHEARYFKESELERYRNDPALQYEKPILPEEPGLWDRFVEWVLEKLGNLFGKPASAAMRVFFNKYFIYTLIFGGALFVLIIALRKAVFTNALRGKAKRAQVLTDVHEELHRDDLDALVAQAEAEGEWRRAVRLRYLKVLRYGMDSGRLQWRPEHTDRDYARQLTDPAEREAFARIAFTFQWAWYGDAHLDRESYATITAPFRTFTQRQAA